MKSTLILGGARSGKSSFAQQLALKSGKPVLFVATAEALDEEMRQRIEEHRKSRPATWKTLETARNVGIQIAQYIDNMPTVLIDCITLLVNNIILQHSQPDSDEVDATLVEEAVTAELSELVHCLDHVDASFIIVTNEVGLGLVPPNRLGRLYRDVLGKANQILAQRCDEVYMMVAGIPVLLKGVQ